MYNKKNTPKKYNHLLVFDTIALLSANKIDRFKVWHNNEKLGICYIPKATYKEICELAKNDEKPQEKDTANAFLIFLRQKCEYRIEAYEDDKSLQINNQNDRQIVACAQRLAKENQDCVVILITYDHNMALIVAKSNYSNLCTLKAEELSKWFYNPSSKKNFKALQNAYKHMKPNKISEQEHPTIRVAPGNINSHSSYNNLSVNQIFYSLKAWKIHLIIYGILGIIIIFSLIWKYYSSLSILEGTISESGATNSRLLQTPPQLIAESEAGILEFQRTQDPLALKVPLNILQELKNKQGNKLDAQGEQILSRLKHKYAIKVLASSGQLTEANSMLRQIPSTYSDIGSVKEWLLKHER